MTWLHLLCQAFNLPSERLLLLLMYCDFPFEHTKQRAQDDASISYTHSHTQWVIVLGNRIKKRNTAERERKNSIPNEHANHCDNICIEFEREQKCSCECSHKHAPHTRRASEWERETEKERQFIKSNRNGDNDADKKRKEKKNRSKSTATTTAKKEKRRRRKFNFNTE